MNRLTNATGSYGAAAYTYDDVGNRLTKTINSDTDTYAYVTDTNRIDNIAGTATVNYSYDANGNAIDIGDRILVYNQNNRLIRVEENSAVLGEYTYNGLGQRVIKEVDGVQTIFHYDFDGKLIAEGLADGTITKEYLYKYNDRLAMVDVASGNLYMYLNDYLGTPQMLTDETNTVVWEALYKPFGEGEVNPNSSIVNNIRLPGQYYDAETGFHYNYFRYYDPGAGRYLRPDPIGLAGMDPNIYGYVLNNPINRIDYYGLSVLKLLKMAWYGLKARDTVNDLIFVYGNVKKAEDVISQRWEELNKLEVLACQRLESGSLSADNFNLAIRSIINLKKETYNELKLLAAETGKAIDPRNPLPF